MPLCGVMMNDFTLLKSLLNEAALVPIQDRQAKLKETGTRPPYDVNLKDLPDDTLILQTDRFPQPDKILNCQHKQEICKRADYVVVNESEMIFIELKQSKGDSKRIINQLRGAQCVMDYCLAVGKRVFNRPSFLEQATKKPHFVSIERISVQKRNFKQSATRNPNSTPETMLKLKGGNTLRYKQLLG